MVFKVAAVMLVRSVPRINGAFIKHHSAKFVRPSASAKSFVKVANLEHCPHRSTPPRLPAAINKVCGAVGYGHGSGVLCC